MSLAITLENVPDELYEKLKDAASLSGRNIGSEAVIRLETAMTSAKRLSEAEILAKVDAIHLMLADRYFDPDDIDRMKREGRP